MENETSHTERKNRKNICIQNVSNIKNVFKTLLTKLLYQAVKELEKNYPNTTRKRKFSIKYLFSKCDQMCRKLRICSHLLQKFLMENFIFCAVDDETLETIFKGLHKNVDL